MKKTMNLTHKGRDSSSRPVYEHNGRLYVDIEPRKHRQARICTKYKNSFDGEPTISEDIEIIFIPSRDTW